MIMVHQVIHTAAAQTHIASEHMRALQHSYTVCVVGAGSLQT